MQYQNKIILITGAASGIGQVTAHAFAKEGGTVIVSDINEKGGRLTVDAILDSGGTAAFIKADVSRFEEVENLIKTIIDQFGRLDIAINNAGISGVTARTADVSLANWERVMSVNASSVFYCMKLEIQQMMKLLLKLDFEPQSDEADGLAIALCHANHMHMKTLGIVSRVRGGRWR